MNPKGDFMKTLQNSVIAGKVIAAALTLSLGLALSTSAHAALTGEQVMKKSRCIACHDVKEKRIGPAYKDVAAKYHGDAKAQDKLMHKVRHGGSGVWGEMAMPPHPVDKLSDEDLKAVVHWVLGLK